MEGARLLETLIEGTGLPRKAIEQELNRLMELHQVTNDTLTIEQLRAMLVRYLQDVLTETKMNLE